MTIQSSPSILLQTIGTVSGNSITQAADQSQPNPSSLIASAIDNTATLVDQVSGTVKFAEEKVNSIYDLVSRIWNTANACKHGIYTPDCIGTVSLEAAKFSLDQIRSNDLIYKLPGSLVHTVTGYTSTLASSALTNLAESETGKSITESATAFLSPVVDTAKISDLVGSMKPTIDSTFTLENVQIVTGALMAPWYAKMCIKNLGKALHCFKHLITNDLNPMTQIGEGDSFYQTQAHYTRPQLIAHTLGHAAISIITGGLCYLTLEGMSKAPGMDARTGSLAGTVMILRLI